MYAVCPQCRGNGSRVNPSIDGNGITADEMAELGEEFREDYFSGVFDIRCDYCGGKRVVPQCSKCEKPVEKIPWDYEPERGSFFANCYDHLSPEDHKELRDYGAMLAEMAQEQRLGC